jgi:TolB-like protein
MIFTRRNKLIIVCAASLFLAGSKPPEEEDNSTVVGISDFTTEGAPADKQWIGNSCIDAISVQLSSRKNVKVVERKYLSKVIEEIKLQASGLVDENTAVELGNLVAVKYFIFGSAAVSGENLVLRSRIVDVSTSKVVFSSEESGVLDDIFRIQARLSQKIAAALSLGRIESANTDLAIKETLPYAAASKLEKIRKFADQLPFFMLDPARKRKVSEYMFVMNMCDELIENYPGLQKAHYYKGLFSIQADDLATADLETKEAKKLNPEDLDSYLGRAFCFFISGKYEETRQVLQYAASKFPNDSRVWYAMARLNMQRNEHGEAIENLINSMNHSPSLPLAETNLRSLVGSVELYPTLFSNLLYYNIATLYKTLYGPNPVIDRNLYSLARQTADISRRFAMPFYIMGMYEMNNNNISDATINLKRAIRLKPTFSEAHRELGSLLLATGSCYTGRQHVTLYMHSSTAITDAGELQNRIRDCR